MKVPALSSTLLSGLHCFSVAAEQMSFTRAASELNLTQSAVSHRIKNLEQKLGVQLFIRRPRQLTLTPEGEQLKLSLNEQFAAMSLQLRELKHAHLAGDFTISVPPTFGQIWLAPRLYKFSALFPELTLHIRTRNDLVDFQTEAFDCAIYYGNGRYTGLSSVFLFDDVIEPVCSPDYAAAHSLYGASENLFRCHLLHDAAPWASASVNDEWQYWAKETGSVLSERNSSFDRADMAFEAAKNGLGVAIGRRSYVEQDLAAGSLVAPFDMPVCAPFKYHLVYRRDLITSNKVQAFQQWIESEISSKNKASR
ncbi:DNA-binding transcriptional regulator DsdC [Veronia pacifica]|uniref:DNA-binding transcriptional regulator DsdC n=1 Tax=Veronia pacifica TaxID=1080227 RepID=A0A1C3EPY0_9GAMM|nr:DNA-binding transcriptional regulator DsdC [Veronia pacifica]ODA35276.1 DNA-binding transcriptional regulator DsdC [Veronia pacifica]